MIAALPMYDWPENAAFNDLVWARFALKLAEGGFAHPARLTRGGDLAALWLSPDLLIAQTCTYPLETLLKGKVKYVATPSYAVEGCQTPGHYRSVIIKRGAGANLPVPRHSEFIVPHWHQSDRLAVNGMDSMSGFHALRRDVHSVNRGLPEHLVETGGHRASIVAVAEGRADWAAIDCVSWALACQHEAAAKQVHVAGWTKERPGLPLITSLKCSGPLLKALQLAALSILDAVILTKPTEL